MNPSEVGDIVLQHEEMTNFIYLFVKRDLINNNGMEFLHSVNSWGELCQAISQRAEKMDDKVINAVDDIIDNIIAAGCALFFLDQVPGGYLYLNSALESTKGIVRMLDEDLSDILEIC